MGEYLSVITYSDPTQKCPMLDSYIREMQGPRGVCTIYVYGVCNGWGNSGLIKVEYIGAI